MSVLQGLTLTQKEQEKLQTLNMVLEGWMRVGETAYVLGLSECHIRRILAAHRKNGAKALSHVNRGCRPSDTTWDSPLYSHGNRVGIEHESSGYRCCRG